MQPNGVLALDDVKNMWFSDTELQSLDILAGDVVVVEGGIGGFGRAAYVDADLPGFGYQNSINRIRPSERVDGRFLTYLLLTARHAGFIHAYCTGVSMPHLTAEKLAAISIPVPDLSTQTQICEKVDAQISRLNALSDKAADVDYHAAGTSLCPNLRCCDRQNRRPEGTFFNMILPPRHRFTDPVIQERRVRSTEASSSVA